MKINYVKVLISLPITVIMMFLHVLITFSPAYVIGILCIERYHMSNAMSLAMALMTAVIVHLFVIYYPSVKTYIKGA